MFRVNQADLGRPYCAVLTGVAICLLLSLTVTAASLVLVVSEYAVFEERLIENVPLPSTEIAPLTRAVGWQLIGLGTAVVVLRD